MASYNQISSKFEPIIRALIIYKFDWSFTVKLTDENEKIVEFKIENKMSFYVRVSRFVSVMNFQKILSFTVWNRYIQHVCKILKWIKTAKYPDFHWIQMLLFTERNNLNFVRNYIFYPFISIILKFWYDWLML